MELCGTAFQPREMPGIPHLPFYQPLAAFHHGYSRYKTKPLEHILQETFVDRPLFGVRNGRSYSSTKVAVTATRGTCEQAVLLTNYNRSQDNDRQCKYLFTASWIVAKRHLRRLLFRAC